MHRFATRVHTDYNAAESLEKSFEQVVQKKLQEEDIQVPALVVVEIWVGNRLVGVERLKFINEPFS